MADDNEFDISLSDEDSPDDILNDDLDINLQDGDLAGDDFLTDLGDSDSGDVLGSGSLDDDLGEMDLGDGELGDMLADVTMEAPGEIGGARDQEEDMYFGEESSESEEVQEDGLGDLDLEELSGNDLSEDEEVASELDDPGLFADELSVEENKLEEEEGGDPGELDDELEMGDDLDLSDDLNLEDEPAESDVSDESEKPSELSEQEPEDDLPDDLGMADELESPIEDSTEDLSEPSDDIEGTEISGMDLETIDEDSADDEASASEETTLEITDEDVSDSVDEASTETVDLEDSKLEEADELPVEEDTTENEPSNTEPEEEITLALDDGLSETEDVALESSTSEADTVNEPIGDVPITVTKESPAMDTVENEMSNETEAAAIIPAPAGSAMLLNFNHEVVVEVSRTHLTGEEITQITYGSIIELDKVAGEPVDLVLDGKTIAHGEVMLINKEKLGIRIIGIVQE